MHIQMRFQLRTLCPPKLYRSAEQLDVAQVFIQRLTEKLKAKEKAKDGEAEADASDSSRQGTESSTEGSALAAEN